MSDEWAKATQEVAKTGREAVAAGRSLGGFIGDLIKQPLAEQVGIWTDNLRHRRWENQLALHQKVKAKLAELGLKGPFSEPPMAVLIPLLEGASLAEDDGLRDRWANLLLNFSNPASHVNAQRSFVSVLAELTPMDATILDLIYSVDQAREKGRGILTAELPDGILLEAEPDATKPYEVPQSPTDAVGIALGNLLRLGLIESAMTWGGVGSLSTIYQTLFGREFVRACTLAKPMQG